MKIKNLNLLLYGIAILITLGLHYLLLSKVIMHTTLHVFLGVVILFLILFVFTVIFSKGGKK